MSEVFPQDTPIDRASILKLSDEQLVDYIQTLQTRRLASLLHYQAGVAAKAKAKSVKTEAQLDKICGQMDTLFARVNKDLEKLEKLAIDIQAHRLAMGDYN